MAILRRVKESWQAYTGEDETPLDGDTPAWAVSLVVHVGVLLSLAALGLAPGPERTRTITVIEPVDITEEDVFTPPSEVVVSDEVADAAGAESERSESVAEALAPVLADVSVVPVEADENLVSDIELQPVDVLPTGPQLSESVAVRGQVGVGETGASGAVDRLTVEIRNNLERGPTVVCWLFDQSLSLEGQRQEIAARLERVFDELEATVMYRDRPDLKNLVVGFGDQTRAVTQSPTTKVEEVVDAIRSIPVDDSGAEKTFSAVIDAAGYCRVFRTTQPRHNVMIIVFTDEVGNDQNRADEAVQSCRTLGMPVYVVGVPAPFGKREVRFKYVDPDPKYDQTPQYAQIEQGPESFYPELVQVRSGKYADEAMDSGFGPYALSRLCSETGGIYFCVHANRTTKGRVSNAQTAAMSAELRYFFEPEVMRDYAPQYTSVKKLDAMIAANAAKKALVLAASKSELSPMENPTMVFPRRNDGDLANLLGQAQRVAAKIEPKIDALYGVLVQGAKDRSRVKEKRWQAGYDLAMGRVLAMKVRTEAYNRMLAQAKGGMKFKHEGSDTWKLVPDDDISQVGSQLEKLGKQAREYLERVVAEHPGTPWALIAADELKTPLGYVWTEMHTGVNDPKGGGGGGNPQRRDDKKKNLAPPKPKRSIKKL